MVYKNPLQDEERVGKRCESSKALASGHRVVPGSSVTGGSRPSYGIRSASSVSHRRDVSLYGLSLPCTVFSVRVFRAANWLLRRRAPTVGAPTAVLPKRACVVEGRKSQSASPCKGTCEFCGKPLARVLTVTSPSPQQIFTTGGVPHRS